MGVLARAWRTAARPLIGVCILVAVAALVVGRVNEPPALNDDAAISFRYAERLSDGDGLTYNDHERVMGFSNPLWTLTLGGSRVVGLPMIGTAQVLALLLLMASSVLAVLIGRRLSNLGGGIAAGLLLIGLTVYVQQMVSGMEVGLTTTLGLGAVLAATGRREVLCGVLLGLAVLSKFEAGILAAALAGGWWWSYRRIPWRMAVAALATFAPWAIVATAYYGSPVPNSVVTKLGDEYRVFDHAWVVKQVDLSLVVLAGGFTVVRLVRGRPEERTAVLGLFGWFLGLLAVLTVVDFGDNYPWYVTALFPPLAVLAGAALGRVVGALAAGEVTMDRRWLVIGALVMIPLVFGLESRLRSLSFDPIVDVNRLSAALLMLAIAAGVLWLRAPPSQQTALRIVVLVTAVPLVALWWIRASYQEPFRDVPTNPIAEFEVDRVLASRALARMAEPDEVVLTGWGWPAYAAIDNQVLDTSGLNMEAPPPGTPVWHTVPGSPIDQNATPPPELPGYRITAHITHTCRIDPRFSWYAVYVAIGTPADDRSPHALADPEHCGADALAASLQATAAPPG